MISPRFFFLGDPVQAAKYVGVAKKLAVNAFKSGVLSKVWRLGEGVSVRVTNNLQAKICKVWIEAGSEALWYQFITTGPDRETLGDSFKGSAVAVKCPVLKEGQPVDWETVKPLPTGSTLEELPNGTLPGTSNAEIQRIKGMVQIELATEPSYYLFDARNDPFRYQQLLYSWASRPGMIYNAGALSPTPTFGFGDKTYDLSPTTMNGKRFRRHEPNTDWPHDAAIVRVVSEEFGDRTFIVMVDASQRFYCFPRQHTTDEGLASPYAVQNQHVNIPDDQVQSIDPPFPAWVHLPVGNRRDTDYPEEVNSGEPRYVWRFHPQGTKVVGLVLNRETFAGDLWGEKVESPINNVSAIIESWSFSAETIHGVDYTGLPKNDLPGYVEFSLDIMITGLERNEFTFGLTLLQDQISDDSHYWIAADYLSPVVNGWASYGISASPGDLIAMELEVRRGPISHLWWFMESSLERPDRYFRQVWVKVIHAGTATVLRHFLILDQQDDALHLSAYVDTPDQWVLSGSLVGIDLSKLSFTYQARRKRFFVDDEDYYTNGTTFGMRQRRIEEEAGIRLYVFNQLMKEVRAGENFSLWSTLDAVEADTESVVISPEEVGKKSVTTAIGFSNENLLTYLEFIPYAYETWEPYGESSQTLVSYELLDPENITDLEYAVYNGFYSAAISNDEEPTQGVASKATIINQLNLVNDQFVDETFIETWIYPYVKSLLILVLNQIDHLEIVDDPEDIDRKIPKTVWKSGYGTVVFLNGFLSSIVGEYSHSHFDATYFFHYRGYQKPAEVSGFSFVPPTGFATPWLHDYPVGRDNYLQAWWLSVRASMNETLCVSPEGFYSATHELFYANQSLPETSLYTNGISYPGEIGEGAFTEAFHKDRYFIGGAYGVGSDPVSILKNARYSQVNKPTSNCLSSLRMDVVGHINGGQTTHQNLYETAYSKTISLPNPDINVITITATGNYYRYQYVYEAVMGGFGCFVEPSYPELQTETLRFNYRPLLNGSMLFSK